MSAMMILREYAFATPGELGGRGSYRRFCRAANLRPIPDGWGLLFCEDANGRHWTRITADLAYMKMLVETSDLSLAAGLEIPAEKFPNSRPGWPDEWVQGARPAPARPS